MTRIEDLIRESLERRAHDVEPTPALWRRISSRIDRRMRARRLLLAVAGGAAAVLLVVVAVPAGLELVRPSPDIDIAPRPPSETRLETSSGPLPAGVVTTDGVSIDLRRLGTGGSMELLSLEGEGDAAITDVAVRPASTVEDVTVAFVVAFEDVAEIRSVEVVDGLPTPVSQRGAVDAADIGEGPSLAWSPEGRYLAWTSSARGDQPGVQLDYWGTDGPARDDLDRELTLDVPVEGTPRLGDWVGDSADGGSSQLTLTAAGEAYAVELDHAEGDVVQEATVKVLDDREVADLADTRHDAGTPAPLSVSGMYVGPFYALTADAADAGIELTWNIDDGDRSVRLDLPEDIAAADHNQAWMDAWLSAVVVGDGGRAWLVTHDGDFRDVRVAPLGGEVTAADFLPGEEPESVPTQSPSPTSPPATESEGVAADGTVAATLGQEVVVSTGRQVVLEDQDGERRTLIEDAPAEGTIESVAVRPGSTVDELTVVYAVRLPDDTYQLGYTVVREGAPAAEGTFEDGLGPVAAQAELPWPVWSPDGASVAWTELDETSGDPVVRIAGWGDDQPGTGDAETDRAEFEVDGASGVLVASEWAAAGEGSQAIWLTQPADVNGPAYALRVARQPDGAVASDGVYERGMVEGQPVKAMTGPIAGPLAAIVADGEFELIVAPDGSAVRWDLPASVAGGDGLSTPQLDVLGGADEPASFLVSAFGESWWIRDATTATRLRFDQPIVSIEVVD